MSKIDRDFTKATKDYGQLLIGSGQVWSDFEPANKKTEELISQFLQEIGATYPTKGGKQKLILAMCDVIMAARHAPTRLIIWPMDTSCFSGGPYGADFARQVRDCLIAAGFMHLQQKSSRWDKLARLYYVRLPDWAGDCSFKTHGRGPVVEVRSRSWRHRNGKLIGGRRLSTKKFDHHEMARVVSETKQINAMMAKYPLVSPNGQIFMRCRRIFNAGSLKKGGRYYGAWQNFSEEERLSMTIDGSPVAEIDLKACFLVVLGNLYNKGQPKRRQVSLPYDPYSIIPFVRECKDPSQRKQMRNLAKLLVSSVLADKADLSKFPKGKKKKETATGRKATISTREQFGLGKEVKASDYYNEVLATFPFIKTMHLRVFDLMYQESEIIGQTMLKLISQYDIPTFPVHDCLMCRVDDVHLVLEALVATTTELLGAPISLDVTYPDRPTEYYKAVGTELVQCDKDGEVRWNKFTWGLQDDEDFDVIES